MRGGGAAISFNAGSITATLDLDRTPFLDEMAEARRDAAEFARQTYTASLGLRFDRDFERVYDHAEDMLRDFERRHVDATLGLSDTAFNDQIRNANHALDQLNNRRIELSISMRGGAEVIAELREITELANALDGRDVVLRQRIESAGGLETPHGGSFSGGPDADTISRTREENTLLAAFNSISLESASRWGLITAAAGAAGPALGAVGGIFAGLPAIMSVAIAGMAAVKLGMDGIKEAATQLKGPVDQLKAAVATAFARDLSGPFGKLKGVLTDLQPDLVGTAHGITDIMSSIIDVVSSESGLNDIDYLFSNINGFLHQMAPALAQFTQNFLAMATVGSDALGTLGDVINGIVTDFGTMINVEIESGNLFEAFVGAANIIGSLGDAFNVLVGMAINLGAEFGGPLATALSSIVDILADLEPILVGAGELFMQVLLPALQVLEPVIRVLAPAIGTLASSLGSALGPTIQALGPLLAALAEAFGNILTSLAPALPGLAVAIGSVAQAVGGIFLGALQAVEPLMPVLVNLMKAIALAVTELAPLWINMASNLSTLTPFLSVLIDAFNRVVEAILPLILTVLPPLIDAMSGVFGAIGPVIAVVGELAAQLIDALAPVLPIVAHAFTEIITVLTPLIAQIGPLAESLMPALLAVVNAVVPIVGQAADVFVSLFQAVAPLLGPLADLVAQFVAAVAVQVLVPLITGLGNAFIALLQGLAPVIPLLVQAATSLFPMLNGVLAAVVPAVAALVDAVQRMIPPFVQIVQNVLPPLLVIFQLIAEVVTGVLIGAINLLGSAMGLLVPIAVAVVAAMKGLALWSAYSAGVNALAGTVGILGTALSGSVVAGSAMAGSVRALGTALPILGIAIVGIMAAFNAMNTSAAEAVTALTQGGAAADTASEALKRQDEHVARYTSEMPGFLAAAQSWIETNIMGRSTTEQANAALEQHRSTLTLVQRAHEDVTVAQNNYTHAVDLYTAASPQARDAAHALADATNREEQAQKDAKNAAMDHTQALKEQQDQMLAMSDANIAHRQALIDAKKAEQDVTVAIRDHGKGSLEAQEAQLRFESAQNRVIDTAGKQTDALNVNKTATDKAKAATDQNIDSNLYLAATLKDKASPQVRDFVAKLSDEEIQAHNSRVKTDDLHTAIVQLPNGKTIKLEVDPETGEVVDMSNKLKALPPLTRIQVTATGEVKGSGKTGLATGGIYDVVPGYSPGFDDHLVPLSGGEAIMRPEWTRAVGPSWINGANAAARAGGVTGVQHYLSAQSFAIPHVDPKQGDAPFPGLALGGIHGFYQGGIYQNTAQAVPVDYANVLELYGKIYAKEMAEGGGPPLEWARTQVGKPYVWGAVGPNGYDCSGFMSAITNVIRHKSPYSRVGSTGTFPWAGFQPGIGPGLSIGAFKGNPGHMAGTIGNTNVESSGHVGVRVGGGARGASNSMFNVHAHLPFDEGGWLPPGNTLTFNGTRKPEAVLTAEQWDGIKAGRSLGADSHEVLERIHETLLGVREDLQGTAAAGTATPSPGGTKTNSGQAALGFRTMAETGLF